MSDMGHIPSIFTLKMGRPWLAAPLPSHIEQGPARQCYRNAGTLAMTDPELTYVEGYACPPGGIPVHHAWCVDSAGRVIDNTFEDAASSIYFGVPISRKALIELLERTKQWGLFADLIAPTTLLRAIEDLQAGPYTVAPEVAEQVRSLISTTVEI